MAEVPASFGKYYLTEKLAAGGMAEIYLGKLVGPGGFEKLLVIKQIHPRLSGQRHFVDLFVAEAKILVGLVHGNIVPVYELGVIGETYYIAMEYIDGPSLYRLTEQLRIKGARMAPTLAAHIATKILDGLDYAHRKGDGIIHRDLSGRNVMLSRDGEVKLVDFGIAVTLGEGGDVVGETPAGSFPYMSPEQVLREPLTGQSDLFSAGILFWEMLAGERLFARPDASATLQAVTDAELVPPSVYNPEVPARLDEVVMKALARDRGERWQTAADMLAALHRYLYSLEETPGARDLGRLVARYCPPTARRRPTEGDASPVPQPGGDSPSTAVIPREVRQQSFATHVELAGLLHSSAEPGDSSSDLSGNAATAVAAREVDPALAATAAPVEGSREDAGSEGGERTAALPPREARPTPAPALSSSPGSLSAPPSSPLSSPPSSAASSAPSSASRTDATPAASAVVYPRAAGIEAEAAMERSAPHTPHRRPARRRIAALASLALIGGIAVVAVSLMRQNPAQPKLALADSDPGGDPIGAPDPLLGDEDNDGDDDEGNIDAAVAAAPDALTPRDARPRPPLVDAGAPRPSPDARRAPAPDARLPRVDARPPVDARPIPTPLDARPTDARLLPAPPDARTDARQPPRFDARRPEPPPEPRNPPKDPRATSLIKVGANPWGEVYLDGKLAGRTPLTLTVPAGRHEIEVAFPVGDPPRRETYRLDLDPGETRSVLADFTQ